MDSRANYQKLSHVLIRLKNCNKCHNMATLWKCGHSCGKSCKPAFWSHLWHHFIIVTSHVTIDTFCHNSHMSLHMSQILTLTGMRWWSTWNLKMANHDSGKVEKWLIDLLHHRLKWIASQLFIHIPSTKWSMKIRCTRIKTQLQGKFLSRLYL